MTSQGVANTFYGLGMIKFNYVLADSSVRNAILQAQEAHLPNMSTIGISSSLFGLSLMGVSWYDWKDSHLSRLELAITSTVRKMDERAFASVVCS